MSGRVTERDEEWLAWMGRWRSVTAGQIAGWWVPELAAGVKVVERRLRVWRKLGLIESRRIILGLPATHWLTRAGMVFAGVTGPVRKPVVGQLEHDLAVVDCAVWLRQTRGVRMVTEREIRAAEPVTVASPRWAVKAVEGAGRRVLYPDLVTVDRRDDGSARAIAHEVERAPKEHRRLVGLMRSYVGAPNIAGAVYYARPNVARQVRSAAEAANAAAVLAGHGRRIWVQDWTWQQETETTS